MQLINYLAASFYASRAGIYFNRVLMVSHLAEQPDAEISKLRELWFQDLRTVGKFYVQMIQQADSIYKKLSNLPPLELPKYPEDYFGWAKAFLQNMHMSLTIGSAEEQLFSYGFHLGNAYCNVEVLNWALALHQIAGEKGFDQREQVKGILSDLSDTQFRWGTSAMLLGREEATKFMWERWRELDERLRDLQELGGKAEPSQYPALAELGWGLAQSIEAGSKYIFENLQKFG